MLLGHAYSQDFNLLSNASGNVSFEHHLQEKPFAYENINNVSYVNFGKSHKITTQEKGEPQLPMFSESVMIAEGSNPELTIEFDNYYEIQNISISPSKGTLKRNINPADIPYEFSSIYTQNAFYPASPVVIGDPFTLRNTTGVTVTFYPYQYNPVTKTLRVYENLRVVVSSPSATTSIDSKDPFASIYQNFYINAPIQNKYTPVGETGEMLVITTDAFTSTIQPFVQWKNEKGIKTTLVTTATTGTTASQIKTYIQNYYTSNPNLMYILMVGDHADVPAHTYGTSGGESLYSDSYYGQLAGGTNDYYPDVFVGRFSGNASQIATMVSRVREYEALPAAGNWMTKAIGIGSDEGAGYGDDGESDWQHQRNLRTKLMNYGYTEVAELYDGSHGGADASGSPNASSVLTAMNAGCGLINYTGHGDQSSFVTTGFSSTSVNSANNNGFYPFVISVACNNGTFTSGTCISESLLRRSNGSGPAGAIAACGSSILMNWAEPMQTQDELVEIITEAYANNKKQTLGGIFYNAQMSMLEEYNNASGAKEVMQTWIFFGDPSTVFRNKLTQYMYVTHTNWVPAATSTVIINCNQDGALVAISQDGVLLGTGYAIDGQATITFPALTSDHYLVVTATKQNFQYYQGSIQVGNGAATIIENEIDQVAVYPVPANDILTVSWINSENSDLNILDISGKSVYKTQATEVGITEISVPVSAFQSGVYFLEIISGNKKTTKKVIIE